MRDFEEAMKEISHIYSNAAFRQSNENSRQCPDKTKSDNNTHLNIASSHRKLCYNCHQYGHYARSCPSVRDSSNDGYKMHRMTSYCQAAHQVISPGVENKNKTLMFINVKINDHSIKGLVDTGSEITMISHEIALSLGLTIDRYKGHKIKGVNGVHVEITGQSKVNVVIFDDRNERVIPITVLTVQNFQLKFLLGYDFNYASKSLIDIFNNKIIFDPRAARNQQIISTLHSTNNVEGIANCAIVNDSTPKNDVTKVRPKSANASNMSCHVKRNLEIDDNLIECKKRLDFSDTIELVDSNSILNSFAIEHRPQGNRTTANSDEKFDAMSVKRTAEIIKKDFLAYGIFKEILKRVEPNTEIWPTALTLCHYCISLNCILGDQCPQKVLHESEQYSEDVFLRRTNVYSLCLRYDTWLSRKQNKSWGNKTKITEKVLKFDNSDLKEIAECMFQDLYTRAVDETYDHLNVIYYYYRLCYYCNRYKCCDTDQICNFKPAFDKCKSYRAFKQLERQELGITMKNYLERNKVSQEIIETYRLNESKLVKYPIIDITNERPQKAESMSVFFEDKIEAGNNAVTDCDYENSSTHYSNYGMEIEVLTSNAVSISEKENAEKIMFCNASYNTNGKEILFLCESNSNDKCNHLNANEIKKNSKTYLHILRNKTQKLLLLLFLMSLFGIFEIYKSIEISSIITTTNTSDDYNFPQDFNREKVMNETTLNSPRHSCVYAYQSNSSEYLQNLIKFYSINKSDYKNVLKSKQFIFRLYLVMAISLTTLFLENFFKIT
jgi:hypothetical protein